MTVAKKYMEIELDELRIQEVPCYDAQCSAVFKGTPILLAVRHEKVFVGTYFHEDVAIKSLGSGNSSHTSLSMFSDEPPHPEQLMDLRHEVSVMRRLSHNNIVRFKGMVMEPPCIVLEYCQHGSLWNLLPEAFGALKAKWEINPEAAWIWRLNIAIQIAKGMHYLHKQTPTVLHNDLKSPNVFVDENWCVKVGDFGSASVGQEMPSKLPDNNTWKAPEAMRGEKPTVKSDVFSYAVILWELYTFERPWDNLCASWDLPGKLMKFTKNRRIQEKIMNGERLKFPDQVIGGKCHGIQKEFRQLIDKCWKSRPKHRPDFEHIISTLTKLLQKLEKPKETAATEARLLSMKELKEARTNSSVCLSFGKLNSFPNNASWPSAIKQPASPTAKNTKSKRAQSKWLLFNIFNRGGALQKKKEVQSHVVHSVSSSSGSTDDLRGSYESGINVRSPFETKPSFLKHGSSLSFWFKGESSVDAKRARMESSGVESIEKSKWESDASRVGMLNTLSGRSGTDDLAAVEKSLQDYFATQSSSFEGLDAYIHIAKAYHQSNVCQKTGVFCSSNQSGPQPFVPCPQLFEFCPDFERNMRR